VNVGLPRVIEWKRRTVNNGLEKSSAWPLPGQPLYLDEDDQGAERRMTDFYL